MFSNQINKYVINKIDKNTDEDYQLNIMEQIIYVFYNSFMTFLHLLNKMDRKQEQYSDYMN